MKYYLEIKEPCSENWESMSPTEKGRFCSSCEKEVIDFSTFKEGNIISIIKKSGGNICGRIQQNKLNHPIKIKNRNYHHDIRKLAAGFLLINFLGMDSSSANTPLQNKDISDNTITQTPTLNKITTGKNQKIKGKVKSKLSGEILVDVRINVENSKYGTYSDSITGEYLLEFHANSNDSITINFFCLGYKINRITFHKNEVPEKLDVELEETFIQLDDVIIYEKIMRSNFPKNELIVLGAMNIMPKGNITLIADQNIFTRTKYKIIRGIKRIHEILRRNPGTNGK